MKKLFILFFVGMLMICLGGCSASETEASVPDNNSGSDNALVVDIQRTTEEKIIAGENSSDDNIKTDEITRDYSQGLQEFEADYSYGDGSDLYFEYFDEFYGHLMYEGLPEGRTYIPLKYANGAWKYSLIFRFDSSDGGGMFDEIGYAEMYVHGEDNPPITIILHPRMAQDGFEVWLESDEEIGYEPFGGGFDENDNLKLSGNYCVMQLEQYYAYEGREYLYGTLWTSEETFGDFLMVRGQD